LSSTQQLAGVLSLSNECKQLRTPPNGRLGRRGLLYQRPASSPRLTGDRGIYYWRNSYRLQRESARFTKVSS
jgi:hypothetical protein